MDITKLFHFVSPSLRAKLKFEQPAAKHISPSMVVQENRKIINRKTHIGEDRKKKELFSQKWKGKTLETLDLPN